MIGAGLGGLSAAAHLSNRGHEITIFERSSLPGGRAGLVTADGFRLDNGPTVLTMPNLLAEAFNAAGADMADFVTIKPVDPMYRAVYADGSTLFVRHGREAMTEEIRAFAGAKEAAAFGRFCDWLTELYRAEMPSFIDANFNSPLDLLKPWRAGLELVKLGGFGRLGRKVASFFDDERLRRIFSFQSMYAGLAPYEALALYAVITYMDSVEGVFVPVGGMHMMGVGLAAAVTKAGVDIRYDTAVSSITRAADGRITGVVVEGGEHVAADAVVCNADLPVAYRELLADLEAPRAAPNRYGTRRRACCGSPACAACRRRTPPITTSTSVPTGTARSGHSSTTGCGCPTPRYSSRCTASTTAHSHRRTVRASTCSNPPPTPRPSGAGSTGRANVAGSSRTCGAGRVRSGIPPTSSSRRCTTRPIGNAWAWNTAPRSHSPIRSSRPGPFRPNNVNRKAPGLVFTGSSTLPGVGVPMVLVSGKLAAQRVDEYAAARRRC